MASSGGNRVLVVACSDLSAIERPRSESTPGERWSLLSVQDGTTTTGNIPAGVPQYQPLSSSSSSMPLSREQMRYRLRQILNEALVVADDFFLELEASLQGNSTQPAPRVVMNLEDTMPSN